MAVHDDEVNAFRKLQDAVHTVTCGTEDASKRSWSRQGNHQDQ